MKSTRVSIVLEWDNSITGGAERARSVLAALSLQLTELDRDVELVSVFDDQMLERVAVERALADRMPPGVPVTLVASAGSRYYEQKNLGASRAKGDIVLFVDSDTKPEPGWLAEMVRPFDDASVEAVAGAVYTEAEGLSGKAFALSWNFPLRPSDGVMEPTVHFSANTVAFRRLAFLEQPFPDDLRFRGQCHTLALALAERGVTVWSNPNARVAHPRPSGFGYIIRRAICRGHDRLLTAQLDGTSTSFGRSLHVVGSDLKRSLHRVRAGRRRVGLAAWQVPAAVGLAWWYDGWSWVGWQIARVRPQLVRRHLRV